MLGRRARPCSHPVAGPLQMFLQELEALFPPELVLRRKALEAHALLVAEDAIDLEKARVRGARAGDREDRILVAVFGEECPRRDEPRDVRRLGELEDARDVIVDAVTERVDA